jgi:hypothetical protein
LAKNLTKMTGSSVLLARWAATVLGLARVLLGCGTDSAALTAALPGAQALRGQVRRPFGSTM